MTTLLFQEDLKNSCRGLGQLRASSRKVQRIWNTQYLYNRLSENVEQNHP